MSVSHTLFLVFLTHACPIKPNLIQELINKIRLYASFQYSEVICNIKDTFTLSWAIHHILLVTLTSLPLYFQLSLTFCTWVWSPSIFSVICYFFQGSICSSQAADEGHVWTIWHGPLCPRPPDTATPCTTQTSNGQCFWTVFMCFVCLTDFGILIFSIKFLSLMCTFSSRLVRWPHLAWWEWWVDFLPYL